MASRQDNGNGWTTAALAGKLPVALGEAVGTLSRAVASRQDNGNGWTTAALAGELPVALGEGVVTLSRAVASRQDNGNGWTAAALAGKLPVALGEKYAGPSRCWDPVTGAICVTGRQQAGDGTDRTSSPPADVVQPRAPRLVRAVGRVGEHRACKARERGAAE